MDHKELDVWKTAMDLVEAMYKISSKFPDDKHFLAPPLSLREVARRCALDGGFDKYNLRY